MQYTSTTYLLLSFDGSSTIPPYFNLDDVCIVSPWFPTAIPTRTTRQSTSSSLLTMDQTSVQIGLLSNDTNAAGSSDSSYAKTDLVKRSKSLKLFSRGRKAVLEQYLANQEQIAKENETGNGRLRSWVCWICPVEGVSISQLRSLHLINRKLLTFYSLTISQSQMFRKTRRVKRRGSRKTNSGLIRWQGNKWISK